MVAAAFFALSPLAVRASQLLLPDGLLLLFYLLAVYAFLRWLEHETRLWFGCALVATVAAILVKAVAVHLGLFFAVLVFEKHGTRAFRLRQLWVFAAVALGIPALWYVHAKRLWLTYGNSLGVSNEYHWIGLDVFTDRHFVGGIAKLELLYVWMPSTVVLVAIGLFYARDRRAVRIGIAWLAAIGLYYLTICRTASGIWAIYYHVVSVAPVALLTGAGAGALASQSRRWVRVAGLVSLAGTVFLLLRLDYAYITDWAEDPRFSCAKQFRPLVPSDGLIVASGGGCFGPFGNPSASNKPYMFYWLERKGFNICEEQQSIDGLWALAQRGATVFVAERDALRARPGFEDELRRAFPVIAECNAALLISLASPPRRT
jgi:hypothetical protein